MKQKIAIEGMNCGHCSARIEKGLSELDGVNDVDVSLENKEADVVYDESKIAIKDIADKIEDLGYIPNL
ncbi:MULTISPECIES: copper ion binding protein [Enterococcaceae]|uniref:heavy-metal-associated domain-containing protein n=1 Tax=Enterococcaceae TaxID=81852 RepID=UPI000E546D12|nr:MULTISPECIES: copper ion binding protein [Enterococcaceae]MCI0131289.1 copper ion binding protein [Vagococcus sp. CY53-2]RGI28687.1 heavy-metal-associated domain-containing protein [Melissococcus sp. OM08-11BH]